MFNENLLESGSIIERGFLSNRALEILSQNKKLTEEDLVILADGEKLIKIIIQGKEQVSSGKLGDNSLNAANAYSSTLAALIAIDKEYIHKLEEYINKVQRELKVVIDKKEVETNKVKEAKTFFYAILQHSINESSKEFYEYSEEIQWMKPLF